MVSMCFTYNAPELRLSGSKTEYHGEFHVLCCTGCNPPLRYTIMQGLPDEEGLHMWVG